MEEAQENVGSAVFIFILAGLTVAVPFIIVAALVMGILHISIVIPWYISRYFFRKALKWLLLVTND